MDFDWKSSEQLIQYLVGNASLGGNYQLNVGPTGTGLFQLAAIRRLREIGAWIDVNGESLYGTQASPLGKMPWGKITSRPLENGNTVLYLHLWEIQPDTALHVEGLTANVVEAKVLETGQSVTTESGTQGTWVQLPAELATLGLPVIAVVVERTA